MTFVCHRFTGCGNNYSRTKNTTRELLDADCDPEGKPHNKLQKDFNVNTQRGKMKLSWLNGEIHIWVITEAVDKC